MYRSPELIRSYGLLAEKLGAAQSREELGQALFNFIDANLDIRYITLFLYDFKEARLRVVVSHGFTAEQLVHAEATVMERHPGKCFLENRILHIADTSNPEGDQHITSPRDFVVQSALVIPVRSNEKAMGALTMASETVNSFDQGTIDVIQSACNVTGIAYRNILRLEEQGKLMTELIAAKRDAELINQDKTQFLANVSHELRTPIHGLRGLIDLLNTTDDPVQKERYVAFIAQNLGQLETVVEDLLDISMSQAERLLVKPDWVCLDDIVPGLVTEFMALAEQKGLKFEIDVPLHPEIEVYTDSSRIRQVISILLSNAVKYTEKGMVKLHATCEFEGNQKVINLNVIDTGMGISHAEIHQIFDPFFRTQESAKSQLKGSGLGLAVCKELVHRLEGSISVESKQGEGSTFMLNLSFPYRERVVENNALAEDSMPLKGARVLVAEDSEVNQLVIANILEQFGIELIMVSNGEQAWQTAKRAPADLLILDLQMPSMNGIEAIQAIRRDQLNMPAIALTANSDQEECEKCLANGFDAYLSKPFDTVTMRKTMQELLEKHAAQS